MKQELRTILIVVNATLAALFVHYLAEQTEATAGEIVRPIMEGSPVAPDGRLIFD